MKKVIIIITSIILCLSIGLLGYLFIQYKSNYGNNSSKDIIKIEKKIKNNNKEIDKKKEEINKIKEENKDKVEILEVWEKEVKKVRKINS